MKHLCRKLDQLAVKVLSWFVYVSGCQYWSQYLIIAMLYWVQKSLS